MAQTEREGIKRGPKESLRELHDSHKVTVFYCQAQVQIQIQSRSIPGSFQLDTKSFQSVQIQNQDDQDQELMLFSLFHF